MSGQATDNPYQAPTVQSPQTPVFDEDTEFLISPREILIRESVDLPKVCISSGETADLIKRTRTFHSWSLVGGALYAVCAIIVVMLLVMVFELTSGQLGFVPVIAVLAVIFLPRVLTMYSSALPGVTAITVNWYVGQSYHRRCRVINWIIRISGPAAIAVSRMVLTPGHANRGATVTQSVLVLVAILCLFCNVERTLRYQGPRYFGIYRGLHVLTGQSRKFANAVEQIIHRGF